MSAVQNMRHIDKMPYALRPMQEQDLAQAAEIERDAFPTLFPPTSFRRELNNRLAHYLVAWRREAPPEIVTQLESQTTGVHSRFLHRATSLWRGRPSAWQPGHQYLVGFLGTWYMPDEAHIVSVGVRADYRGYGIGELLIIGAIEQAISRRMHAVTLEVRVSNRIAQNLYKKYGFEKMGVRKAYYSDNREDALIMTASAIHSVSYREDLRGLITSHQQRWGTADRTLS
jgi:ribosomal-protein-alanine N-acetyltransferase